MKKTIKTVKTVSAKGFLIPNQKWGTIYEFPFEPLDKTPGGSNLGRIEWCIEPIRGKKTKGRYYIEKLLVWTRQTRDERYFGKLIEIPCHSESITAQEKNSYLHHVWYTTFCGIHKSLIFEAYPENHHEKLRIDTSSSVAIDIDFIPLL